MDNLSVTDAQDVFQSLHTGFIGPYAEYSRQYRTYTQLHNQIEAMFLINAGNKYQVKDPQTFAEVYPEISNMLTLGNGVAPAINSQNHQEKIAKQAAVAVIDSNAPAWLREAI